MTSTLRIRRPDRPPEPFAAGFMLIEVFVAIFVLAIGVIGCVGLQLAALRTAQQSAMQTEAVHLAADIADRLRLGVQKKGNRDLLAQMDYRAQGNRLAPVETCFLSDCTAQQQAQIELAQWQRQIDRALPQGRARVCRDAAPWRIRSGGYTWDCTDNKADPLVIKLGWRGAAETVPGAILNDPPPSLVLAVAAPLDFE
jgi:type IV pilus assembly protein PilV